jgi:integrase
MKTVLEIADEYYLSHDFKNLRDETKASYQYFLRVAFETKIDGASLGSLDHASITTKQAKLLYDLWCDRGIPFANHIMSTIRILYNYAVRMEHCNLNPFSIVRRRSSTPRKVLWGREDIRKLLDVAYGDFNTRNIGLIAHMAYAWCQRVGDMRLLTWDAIDFDEARVHIEQSKRRAEVFLPIDDDLLDMLRQQHDDFGFQQYVAPRPQPIGGSYIPYSQYKLPLHARKLMDEAGLSNELRLSDLRRTGTTEMVEAGVGMAQIMSVTGHANPQSVKPYMKNTYESANTALTARKIHGKST